MEKGLIIFVRNPENGVVKGKLQASLGAERSLEVYNYLLQNTKELTINIHCNHFVFYSHYIHVNDVFDDSCYTKFLQDGDSFGEKLHNAFSKIFTLGCKRVNIIHSDYYDLKQELIEKAFDMLESVDIVAGPATDGDFYLLGVEATQKEMLYRALQKNEARNLSSLIDLVKEYGLSSYLLPQINDVDTVEELLNSDIITRLKEDKLNDFEED